MHNTFGIIICYIRAYIYRPYSVVYSKPLPVTQNTQRGILYSEFFLFVFAAIHNNASLVAARSTCIFHPRSVFALFLRFVYCEFVNTICCCELFWKKNLLQKDCWRSLVYPTENLYVSEVYIKIVRYILRKKQRVQEEGTRIRPTPFTQGTCVQSKRTNGFFFPWRNSP